MIKVIILDFDGVILESVDIKTEGFRELFREPADKADEILQYHLQNNAVSRFIKFRHIYEEILHKPYNAAVEKAVDEKFSGIVLRKLIECPFVTGAVEFLEMFSRALPVYVVSSAPRVELESIIAARDLQGYFKDVFGAPGGKVDFIKAILAKEKAAPAEALYIGDMLEDLKTARKTAVLFIGRRNTEDFGDFDDPVLPDMAAIREFLREKIDGNPYFGEGGIKPDSNHV